MNILHQIISNGYILITPILLWNMFLTKRLPPAYEPKSFNAGIPRTISIGERIGRILIFGLPFFIKLNFSSTIGKTGLIVYAAGAAIYFLSWILLIAVPQSRWCKSMIGFTAPAHTIIYWLAGLTLAADSFYFGIPFSRWYLIVPVTVMSVFHGAHAVYVWRRTYR